MHSSNFNESSDLASNNNQEIFRTSESLPTACLFYSLKLKPITEAKIYDFDHRLITNSKKTLQKMLLSTKTAQALNIKVLKKLKPPFLTSLRDFSIILARYNTDIKKFLGIIPRFRNIQTLELIIKFPQKYSQTILIAACVRRLSSLREFKLDTDHATSFLISNSLKFNSETLWSLILRISLTNSAKFNLDNITRIVKNLRVLKNFDIDINGSNAVPEGFESLFIQIGKLKTLESLSLNLVKFINLTDQGLQLLTDSLVKLTCLTSFEFIIFSNSCLSNEGIVYFADSFLKLSALTNLKLTIDHTTYITSEGLLPLINTFSGLKLKTLSLNMYRNAHINSSLIARCSDNLVHLKTLKDLTLHFTDNKGFTDLAIVELNKALHELGLTLTVLSIFLTRCPRLTDVGVDYLIGCLKHFKSLEKLIVEFDECESLKEPCIKNLSENLKPCSGTLKRLTFSIKYKSGITDEGFEEFSKNLQNFHALEKLQLGCFESKIKHLRSFAESLAYLTNNITILVLSFSASKTIVCEELEELVGCIQKMKKLKHLHLDFKGCISSPEIKKKLSKLVFDVDTQTITF